MITIINSQTFFFDFNLQLIHHIGDKTYQLFTELNKRDNHLDALEYEN